MKKTMTLLAAGWLALLAVPASSAQDQPHLHDTAIAGTAMSAGEVLKIDKEAAKITLRHGPLANLGMPGMTMAFRVAQPAMLDQVNIGDRVHFVAEKAAGVLTIVTLVPRETDHD